jgi:hypothetical protein
MSTPDHQPFSIKWVVLSMIVFITVELILGGLVGNLIVGKFTSINLKFTLQGVLNLSSYLIGGFIVGLVSPGIRIHEPGVGAFLAIALMLTLTLFTPFAFIQFSPMKLLLGGGIAFCLAIAGAMWGERLAGNKLPED